MKNILSIDFDIIMAPSINLYNAKVPQLKWDSLLKSPYYQLATADLLHYKRFDHEQIAYKLMQNPNEKYVITNIDHHHDIAYHDDEISYLKGPPQCGTWVKWLIDRGVVERYHWVNNFNSESIFKKELEVLINTTTDFREFSFNNYAEPNEVFIVLSPAWVPPEYQNLFYCWMDMLNHIYNTHFDFEDWRPKND